MRMKSLSQLAHRTQRGLRAVRDGQRGGAGDARRRGRRSSGLRRQPGRDRGMGELEGARNGLDRSYVRAAASLGRSSRIDEQENRPGMRRARRSISWRTCCPNRPRPRKSRRCASPSPKRTRWASPACRACTPAMKSFGCWTRSGNKAISRSAFTVRLRWAQTSPKRKCWSSTSCVRPIPTIPR